MLSVPRCRRARLPRDKSVEEIAVQRSSNSLQLVDGNSSRDFSALCYMHAIALNSQARTDRDKPEALTAAATSFICRSR